MYPPSTSPRYVLSFALVGLLLLAACGAETQPGWTFAPLGPTPQAATPGPDETPDPEALTLNVTTTEANQLAFEPAVLEAPPSTQVTVVYLNDSSVLHNIHFFAGPDRDAPSLAQTELVTGPGAEESVTFTTPDEPGDFFFVCDVHPEMTGTLRVGD
jgi:plastocyanin